MDFGAQPMDKTVMSNQGIEREHYVSDCSRNDLGDTPVSL